MVRLIHWNAAEAKQLAAHLNGFEVVCDMPDPSALLKAIRDNPPQAVVISLDRLPMQGRNMALAIRHRKLLVHIPLVFVGGEPEKIAKVRETHPNDPYTTWPKAAAALKKAIASPPPPPAKVQKWAEMWKDTPVSKKLGIKPGTRVQLIEPPRSFFRAVSDVEADYVEEDGELIIWFVRNRGELEAGIRGMYTGRPLWIAWPKKASGPGRSDLTMPVIREIAATVGLVDYKICAIDADWSGMLFGRKARRP